VRGVVFRGLADDDTRRQACDDGEGESHPVLDAQEIQDAESSDGNEQGTDVGSL
jgi:hypothetical protein